VDNPADEAGAVTEVASLRAENDQHVRDWYKILLAIAEVVDTEGDPEALVADEFDPWEALRGVASLRARVEEAERRADENFASYERVKEARSAAERERDSLREALGNLIDSIEATKTRDAVVIRDIASARALFPPEEG
jgi:hypothetical protein